MQLGKMGDWVLERILGTTDASARPCENPSYWQYLCGSDGYKYRRSCYYDNCDRRTHCGPLKWTGNFC